jgi:quinol monooxygenase YgiN
MAHVTVGLLVTLTPKEGKEQQVAELLESARALVETEPETVSWFSFRIDGTRFGIFDVFPDNSGRDAHLRGQVAQALLAKSDELLAQPPTIEPVDVVAAKL